MQNKVPELLYNAARIYEERNKMYGDNYKRFGYILQQMFPKGLRLNSAEEFNRFGVFVQIMAKCTRYAENFVNGGHPDSLDDTAVYAMMLQELDALSLAPELPFDAADEVDRMRGKT